MDILNDVTIEPGQTFSFENTSTAKTYNIALQLKKWKEEVDEQEQWCLPIFIYFTGGPILALISDDVNYSSYGIAYNDTKGKYLQSSQ